MIPPLHVVTDDEVLGRPDFLPLAAEVLAAGGVRVALHVRGPRLSGRRIHDAARALLVHTRAAGAQLFVNDRVDVALTVEAHGVHLGRRSLAAAEARRLLGPRPTIGCSAHDIAEALAAEHGGADYVFVGAIFPSASHPDAKPAGTALLRACTPRLGIPVLAIGGIDPARVDQVREAGAYGVAAIRGVWGTDSPARAVEAYLNALTARG